MLISLLNIFFKKKASRKTLALNQIAGIFNTSAKIQPQISASPSSARCLLVMDAGGKGKKGSSLRECVQYRAAAALGGDGEAKGGQAEGDHQDVHQYGAPPPIPHS